MAAVSRHDATKMTQRILCVFLGDFELLFVSIREMNSKQPMRIARKRQINKSQAIVTNAIW